MRRYESVVILDPDMVDDDIRAFTEKYAQLVKTGGGEIIKIEDWGPKRLAYLVKKKDKGRYILFDFVGAPALIAEMERQFKISEDVMKFLSVKLEHVVDLEAFKTDAKAEAPAETAEAPAAEEPAAPAEMEAAAETPAPETAEAAAPAEPEAQPTPEATEAPAAEQPAETTEEGKQEDKA